MSNLLLQKGSFCAVRDREISRIWYLYVQVENVDTWKLYASQLYLCTSLRYSEIGNLRQNKSAHLKTKMHFGESMTCTRFLARLPDKTLTRRHMLVNFWLAKVKITISVKSKASLNNLVDIHRSRPTLSPFLLHVYLSSQLLCCDDSYHGRWLDAYLSPCCRKSLFSEYIFCYLYSKSVWIWNRVEPQHADIKGCI